ncbi:MAG: alpha/beta hydrolase-fold protein [Bacteroidales bacterium]|nr:alpha/beta hydrolase-fold protein [Bacteroidales bacterium]
MIQKVKFSLLIISLSTIFTACSETPELTLQPTMMKQTIDMSSPSKFYHSLPNAIKERKTPEKMSAFGDSIYQVAKAKQWIPIVFGDTAIFLYKHTSESAKIQVFGDLNGWSDTKTPQITLSNITGTKLFWAIYKAPSATTRVDYKLVVNGTWVLDPANNRLAWGGFGPNSELALGEYVYSQYVNERTSGNKGTLSPNQKIHSDSLNYDINYKVYLPNGYVRSEKYPVLFTTDGQEYSDKQLGATTIVADNLLMDNKIKPIIIVFVDPRDPITATNKRMTEYVNNRKFTAFLAVELYNKIKTDYSIIDTPEQTAILGTSLGGINSAFTGILRPDVFGLIGIQSPAFWYYPDIHNLYASTPTKKLKIYMDTGTIYDTQADALQMENTMSSKGYQLQYGEYDEGHSWANWRARIDDILLYFFAH